MFYIVMIVAIIYFAMIITLLLLKGRSKDGDKYSKTLARFEKSETQTKNLLEKINASQQIRENLEKRMGELEAHENEFQKLKIANDTLKKEKNLIQEKVNQLEMQLENLLDVEHKDDQNDLNKLKPKIALSENTPEDVLTKNDCLEEESKPEVSISLPKSKKKMIGEILVDSSVISDDTLKEALHYQKNFGVGIAQCLVTFGHISEQDLAQSISYQYSTPYMPLSACTITEDIIKLVPYEIARKYHLMPIDKTEQTILVVMSNPLDTEAISAVVKATNHQVMAFVGILSDLDKAINQYYKSEQDPSQISENGNRNIFIQTQSYEGVERRDSIRLNAQIPMCYKQDDQLVETKTKDVSVHGCSFKSTQQLMLGTKLSIKISLPESFCNQPAIEADVEVIRIDEFGEGQFLIGTKFSNISQGSLNYLMQYAHSLIT